MGKIVIKTPDENDAKGTGVHIHIPEELWELSRTHEVHVEDGHTGERYLVIDMNEPKVKKPKGPGFATPEKFRKD
jgi:hypothetical protein